MKRLLILAALALPLAARGQGLPPCLELVQAHDWLQGPLDRVSAEWDDLERQVNEALKAGLAPEEELRLRREMAALTERQRVVMALGETLLFAIEYQNCPADMFSAE